MAKIKPKVDLAGLQLLGFQEPKIDGLPTEKLKASEGQVLCYVSEPAKHKRPRLLNSQGLYFF